MMPQDVPPGWRARYAGAIWERQTIGRSNASVYRVSLPDGTLFVKSEQHAPLAELPDEIERLEWLAQRAIACPRIVDLSDNAGPHWLLMSAVPGRDLTASDDLTPDRLVHIYVEALQRLHAIDIADCPFDQRLDRQLSSGAARVAAGLVDEDDFDTDRAGWTAAQVLEAARQAAPTDQDLVVCHGDACLPNLQAEDGMFTGFLDCGRLGVADRYQDLALAHRSIAYNLDASWADAFLVAYGVSAPDRERMAYFRMLDELF